MDIKTMVLDMYPYWLLGIFVILMTIFAGKKDVLRIEKPAVKEWVKFLLIVTVYRYFLFKLFPHFSFLVNAQKNITLIPWIMTLTVFWEDACHGLPMFFIKKWVGDRKLLKPLYYLLLGLVMIEFGAGHLYQGILASLMLMFYVPYSIKFGEKYGFGTVMVCHTLFDLTTILSMKYLLGA